MRPRDIPLLLQETALAWYQDRGPRLGAALAFYTLFSIAPLLIIVIAVAALAFGREAAQTQLLQQIETFVGAEGGQVIKATLEHVSRPRSGILATLIGLATLLFGATVVFSELQDALNTIWKVPPNPRSDLILGIIHHRLLSFLMVLGISFLLLLSIIASSVLTAVMQLFGDILPRPVDWLRSANFILSFVLVTLLFAMIYKVLPNLDVAWGDVLVGALATAVLFMAGKYMIELYLGYSTIASLYGAAGSLVVLLMWVYYSAQLLYLGAEFTKVYAQHRRQKIAPQEASDRAGEAP